MQRQIQVPPLYTLQHAPGHPFRRRPAGNPVQPVQQHMKSSKEQKGVPAVGAAIVNVASGEGLTQLAMVQLMQSTAQRI